MAVTACLPVDLRAEIAGGAGEGLRQIRRLDVAVLRVLNRADDALGLAERPDFLDLIRRQELDLDPADRRRDARVIAVFVHAVAGARKADVGDLAGSRR